mmetsp:Transcript_41792/g.53870  ORF Transcript_41792/g.53870 Transcript_41792/m.53870 type:complete len:404 (-) Transcript_41792:54-1265(-)
MASMNTQELACTICEELFSDSLKKRRPLILTCGHSFCRLCCNKLIKKNQIKCPNCNAPSVCDNVDKLAQNWSLISMLQTPPPPPPPPVLKCQNPEACPSAATQYCSTCNDCFCEDCAVSTHDHPLLRSHKMCAIENRKPKCKSHPDYLADMYCETDKELICMKCHLVGKHVGHSVRDVQDVSGDIRQELKNRSTKATQLDGRLQTKLNELASDVKDLEASARESLAEVDRVSDLLMEQVLTRRLELETTIHRIKQEKLVKCNEMQQKVVEAKSALSSSTTKIEAVLKEYDYDVLESAANVARELEGASKKSNTALQQKRLIASVKFASSIEPLVSLISKFGCVDIPAPPTNLTTTFDHEHMRVEVAWDAVDFGGCAVRYELKVISASGVIVVHCNFESGILSA